MGKVLSKSALYRRGGWTPHPAQEKVLRSGVRSRIVAAGRRFGKSELGAFDSLLPEAFRTYTMRDVIRESGKRWEYWIVGPEYTDAEKEFRKLWNMLRKLDIPMDKKIDTEGIGSRYNADSGDMSISLWGGQFYVQAKSAKYPQTLIGEGLRGVVLVEAAKLKESVYDKFIRPTLADYRGWLFSGSTPEGKNWFYRQWQRGQDPKRPTWDSWRFPAWENPFVYPLGGSFESVRLARKAIKHDGLTPELIKEIGLDPEIAELLEDMTDEKFNQEIGADFNEFVGRVFKEFDEEVHVADLSWNPNPRWQTFAAVDYGWTNPAVWILIQVDPLGNVYVLDEVYESGLMIPEFAQMIRDRGLAPSALTAFYPDPASPGDSALLSKLLRVPSRRGTGGEIKDRIDLIRLALKPVPAHLPIGHPERQPKLFIDRKCKMGIRDMGRYRYPENRNEQDKNNPENPLKKDDHFPEALGRFYRGYFGPLLGKSETTTSMADMRR
jgi:hypothetical protein